MPFVVLCDSNGRHQFWGVQITKLNYEPRTTSPFGNDAYFLLGKSMLSRTGLRLGGPCEAGSAIRNDSVRTVIF